MSLAKLTVETNSGNVPVALLVQMQFQSVLHRTAFVLVTPIDAAGVGVKRSSCFHKKLRPNYEGCIALAKKVATRFLWMSFTVLVVTLMATAT